MISPATPTLPTSAMTKAKLIQALLLGLGALLAIGYLIRSNETAHEVAVSTFGGIFGFLTTPFILEISTALLGLIIVMSYNQWLIDKEGDGWVILPEDQAQADAQEAARLASSSLESPAQSNQVKGDAAP